MVQYDEKVIEAFAEELYREAATLVLRSTLKWLLVGLLAGAIGGGAMTDWEAIMPYAAAGGVVCGAVGYSHSKRRVFLLKLQAQTALCQAQIERNTRKST
jgi:hypothetical protein